MGEKESTAPDPSEARKRRKAIMESQRKEAEANGDVSDNSASNQPHASDDDGALDNKKKGRKRKNAGPSANDNNSEENKNKRAQIRYDPDVPMSKEQLAAWRREARRVRNRESAAASRQRIRNRINELEAEVDEWKAKFEVAMERLEELQQQQNPGDAAPPPNAEERDVAKEIHADPESGDSKTAPKHSGSPTSPKEKPKKSEKRKMPLKLSKSPAKAREDPNRKAEAAAAAVCGNNEHEQEDEYEEDEASVMAKRAAATLDKVDPPAPAQLAAAAAALAQAAVALAAVDAGTKERKKK